MVCYFFICVARVYRRWFLGAGCGGTRGEAGMAAVPRVTWHEWGEESLVPGRLVVPALPSHLLGMEMIILIKQLCWEEVSGLSSR